MAYTLAEVTAFYDAAKESYLAVLKAREYSIKDRELRREKLETLREEMNRWKIKMDQLTAGESTKIRVSLAVPTDK